MSGEICMDRHSHKIFMSDILALYPAKPRYFYAILAGYRRYLNILNFSLSQE